MDFKRIQVVLVFFFLIFDMYLLYMLFNRAEVLAPPVQEVTVTLEENLTNRGVQYSELGTEKLQLPFVVSKPNNHLAENITQLTGQTASVNTDGVLSSTMNEPYDLDLGINQNTTGLSTEQRQILYETLSNSDLFISGDSYQNVWYVSTEQAIYVRMIAYDGNPIVDGTAEIRINLDENYHMISYTQTYQAQITQLDSNEEILSEREAMEIIDRRVETQIPDDSLIHYAILVYYQSTSLDGLNVYSPAWQFVYDNPNGRFTVLVDGIKGNDVSRIQVN